MSNFEWIFAIQAIIMSVLLLVALKMLPDSPGAKRLNVAVKLVFVTSILFAIFGMEHIKP